MVTATCTNQLFSAIIKHLVVLFFSACFTISYICLACLFFFLWGALCGVGVLFMAALCKWTHTHIHTLSQDERAVTLPANMILQPWVEWVVEERMSTEYKRGKPLDLQVPAVRIQPCTVAAHIFFNPKHRSSLKQQSLSRKTHTGSYVQRCKETQPPNRGSLRFPWPCSVQCNRRLCNFSSMHLTKDGKQTCVTCAWRVSIFYKTLKHKSWINSWLICLYNN